MNKIPLTVASAAMAGGIFALDRTSKLFVRDVRVPGAAVHGVLDFTRHENHGLVANLPVPNALTLAVTTVVSIAILVKLAEEIRNGRTFRALALACLLGGAVGNLADRLTFGYVFDWILVFNTSILNIADIAIGVGIIGYGWAEIKKT